MTSSLKKCFLLAKVCLRLSLHFFKICFETRTPNIANKNEVCDALGWFAQAPTFKPNLWTSAVIFLLDARMVDWEPPAVPRASCGRRPERPSLRIWNRKSTQSTKSSKEKPREDDKKHQKTKHLSGICLIQKAWRSDFTIPQKGPKMKIRPTKTYERQTSSFHKEVQKPHLAEGTSCGHWKARGAWGLEVEPSNPWKTYKM